MLQTCGSSGCVYPPPRNNVAPQTSPSALSAPAWTEQTLVALAWNVADARTDPANGLCLGLADTGDGVVLRKCFAQPTDTQFDNRVWWVAPNGSNDLSSFQPLLYPGAGITSPPHQGSPPATITANEANNTHVVLGGDNLHALFVDGIALGVPYGVSDGSPALWRPDDGNGDKWYLQSLGGGGICPPGGSAMRGGNKAPLSNVVGIAYCDVSHTLRNADGSMTCSYTGPNGTPQCACRQGYIGERCDVKYCDATTCPGPDNQCVSNECVPKTCTTSTCQNGGRCAPAGGCDCSGTGFTGPTCSDRDTDPTATCKAACKNGSCDATGKCVCTSGWQGTNCDQKASLSLWQPWMAYTLIVVAILLVIALIIKWVLVRRRASSSPSSLSSSPLSSAPSSLLLSASPRS